MSTVESVESIYLRHCAGATSITPHLPRLRALATGLAVAVEFGVKRGASSSALLMGARRVMSFDIAETREARELAVAAGERWAYWIADSITAAVPICDLLFIDSQHDYEQMKAELEAHAYKVQRYLVFHDVVTFGEIGANGETGLHKWTYVRGQSVPLNCLGIRPAIDELMIRDPSWRIAARYNDSHGLLVLERR
jgi:hypothetical protein